MNEFELINKYFKSKTENDPTVVLGIGDDAAILKVPQDQQLVVCVDTIVSGVHFLATTPAAAIGHRALAVNLSDLAAMGAQPVWFTLALTLSKGNEEWVAEFSRGLFELANQYHINLVGGDTTQGPLSLTVQALGILPIGKGLLRSGAKVGDTIYVTGTVGDAGLGLAMLQDKISVSASHSPYLKRRYEYPEPRINIGLLLRDVANSAIDISDGLAADLGHILEASAVGAKIDANKIPLSDAMKESVSPENALYLALTSGDDYELCFTISQHHQSDIEAIVEKTGIACTCIGEIVAEKGLNVQDENGKKIQLNHQGWEHFL